MLREIVMGAPKKVTKANVAAIAVHGKAPDGEHHVVGIGNLRVAICSDGKFWTAQGLEIDYIAQGSSSEDVKANFESGLAATIQQHLSIFGDIKKLLCPAPAEVWKDALDPKTIHNRFSQVSQHEVITRALPFQGIDYLELAAA